MLDLSRLSAGQRQAVLAPDGPLVVVAGPGSGKTMLLATKIAYLVICRQIPPTSILALTFATKAARELRARLVSLLGEQGGAVDVSTFHALGLRIVGQWSEELGLGPGPPVVYGENDARALLREVARNRGLDVEGESLPELAARVERRRLNLGMPDEECDAVQTLVDAYEEVLRRRNAVDYPAMLALPLRLFAAYPRALRLCQDAYRVVLADEFQDVCASQYALLRHLSARHRHLVVVGDPRQALYSWRGADTHILDDVLHDFPEARVVTLSQNFRSTAQIVACANSLSASLPYQELWTGNSIGEAVHPKSAQDEDAEAAFVADEIERLVREHCIDRLGEVAILYRTNQQALPFTVALRERDLPYRVQGSGDLFARREVRDIIAYLRLAHNPDDAAALARIVNVPPRRLGRVAEILREQPVRTRDLLDVARPLSSTAVGRVESLVALIETLHEESRRRPVTEVVDLTLDRTGYCAWLERQADGQARLAGVNSFRGLAERAEGGLASWLTELQLGEEDVHEAEETDRVLLSTIHRAKGGEWRVVFLVGMEEGLLPHARALQDQDRIDEELRVAYVAVTRARERLYLSYCHTRHHGDRREVRRPSRFLRGLPLEQTERAA